MQTDICLTSSAELCRMCHLPAPHSAVGRSEQWLNLCSRPGPSDEDVINGGPDGRRASFPTWFSKHYSRRVA